MNWTKIPTNLLVGRIPDNELVAIVKYQLLWADLEYQPTNEIARRYMSDKQVALARQYLNDIEAQVVADINSTIKHRGGQKTYYKKKQSLIPNNDRQYDNQYDSQSDYQDDRADKIRLDKIIKKEIKEKEKSSYPDFFEVLDFAKKQDEMKFCGGYVCPESEAIQFWLKCQNNHWKENNEYHVPIWDWKNALKYRRDKKYFLIVDVDSVAGYWNKLANAYGLGKINSGDITVKKLEECSRLLVEIVSGMVMNEDTREMTLKELEKRNYDLWRWAFFKLVDKMANSKYLRGETEHKIKIDISFLLNKNNFKELISPNSEKYIDRE